MTANNHDAQQRSEALNITKSYIVQAPAGSGKTELLIQRFLKLLAHVESPNEVLAITFTKKAANEMRERIMNALNNAKNNLPTSNHHAQTRLLAQQVLAQDKIFAWNLLENPNQLRIQTIDSLCVYLAQQLPLLSHFGSLPSIREDANILYQETINEVLLHLEENLPWSTDLANLLLYLDNNINKLQKLLVLLLSKRDQWLPYIQFHHPEDSYKEYFEKNLQQVIVEHLSDVNALVPKPIIAEMLAILQFVAQYTTNRQSPLANSNLKTLPGNQIHDQILWCSICNVFLTKEGEWRKQLDARVGLPTLTSLSKDLQKIFKEYNKRFKDLNLNLIDHEELRLALFATQNLPQSRYEEKQWHILQSLLHILKIVCAQLRITFQQHGEIDFIENTQAALTALGTEEQPTDLVMSLDYQIKHILVDEFQDTSFTHYQFLTKLISGWEQNDGRTLFVVGDPMQSIYRFREAEVSLFIRLWEKGIGQLQLIPLTLSMNFRSTSSLIDWNNHHFQIIFPNKNNLATGAISYSPSVSNELKESITSEIKITAFADDSQQTQANAIVKLIKRLQCQSLNNKIAILVRTRSNLKNILPALKQANITYQAIDIDPLSARQTIIDLISLTCALLHPSDRLAWFSILRAPWCGLTLNDLLLLAGDDSYTLICEQLWNDKIIHSLSSDGQNRLIKIIPILKQKMAERERYTLRYWVEATWLLLGGPACLSDEFEMEDVNAYFSILEELEKTNQFISQEFLLKKIKELSATSQSCPQLQIMTIHAAKGLEFDTVILPHLEYVGPAEKKPILNWIEKPLANDLNALLLAPINETGESKDSIYEYIQSQHKIKLDHEINRLLYVATTRAKNNLYLFFNITKNKNQTFHIPNGSFLNKLWPCIQNDIEQFIYLNNENNDQINKISTSKMLNRFNIGWNNIINDFHPIRVYHHQQSDGFQLVLHDKKYIGSAVHQILQMISQRGTSWWTERNFTEKNACIKFQLLQLGLSGELDNAMQQTLRIIQNALQDTRGQWIVQKHSEAKSEWALSAVIDGTMHNLIIDRTFVDDEGIRWIIDYKTSAFSHQEFDDFLAKEQEKYLAKMQLYARAISMLDNRPIKLGLYFPALPAWKEIDTSLLK